MAKSSLSRHPFRILAGLIAITAPLSLSAADKYWDLNGSAAGTGTFLSGDWDTSSLNWNPAADGQGAATSWQSGDNAFFSAGTDGTEAFIVNLPTAQTAAGVVIQEGDITFTGSAITLGSGQLSIEAGTRMSISALGQISSTGGVVLNGGTLRQTNPTNGLGFLATATPIYIGANGGTVDYTSSGTGTSSFITSRILGVTPGTGTLIKTGVNEIRVQGAEQANNTYGKLLVKQGLFRLGNVNGANFETAFGAVPAGVTPDAITLDGGAIGASVTLALHANRGITIGSNGGTFNGSGGGVITVPGPLSGSGKMVLSGGGGLILGNAGNATTFTGAVQVDLGTLTLNESLNATNLTGTGGTVSVASGKVFTVGSDNASTLSASIISGAGQFTKVGTGVLSIQKEWTNTGLTNINAGTLRYDVSAAGLGNSSQINIGAAGTLNANNINDTVGSLAGSGPIINGGNLTLAGNNTTPAIYNGSFTGTNASRVLTKNGTGTQVLGGINDFTAVTLNAGSLLISGSISATTTIAAGSATVSPLLGGSGSVGTVTATGSGDPATTGATIDPGNTAGVAGILKTGALTITNGAHLSLQIGGVTAGGETSTGYDRVVASGAVSLASGDLKLTLQGSPTFAEGSTLFLLVNNSGAAITGAFGTLNGSAFDGATVVLGGQTFALSYSANFTGTGSDGIANDVALVAVPEPSALAAVFGGIGLLGGFRRVRSRRKL